MAKISCFYNCGASGLTLKNIKSHYAKFHTKFKSYLTPEFTCDSCRNYYQEPGFKLVTLYSPAQNQEELDYKPHYCRSCIELKNQPTKFLKPKNMNKRILSPKKTKKIKSKLKPRQAKSKKVTKRVAKAQSALTLKPSKTKNTPAYYNCLLNQAKTGFKGKITKACQACKTNAPALNLAYKKEAQKLVSAYKQLGVSLSKILSH